MRARVRPDLPCPDVLAMWPSDDVDAFENGLLHYGKNFWLVQSERLRCRPVGQLVHFYYLWKKTARHDAFASRFRSLCRAGGGGGHGQQQRQQATAAAAAATSAPRPHSLLASSPPHHLTQQYAARN
ncbi:hypothetical protein BOX15_Mlig002889g2 [Macrostomum lignano]|uniref:SANT domain-containing protein n=2 Tax=Macrostomum lignano TaxID=282301 RepID=A0A267DI97_9PLAT|nr:hypothetical protein BOX15_Mlig002889g2 [Macrostomum lignano]